MQAKCPNVPYILYFFLKTHNIAGRIIYINYA